MVEILIIAVILGYSVWVIVRRVRKLRRGDGCCGDCGGCTACRTRAKKHNAL